MKYGAIALVPAHGQPLIHKVALSADQAQAAINRQGVAVASFDSRVVLALDRQGRLHVQHLPSALLNPEAAGQLSLAPLLVEPDGAFVLTRVGARAHRIGGLVESARADAHGHFAAPRVQLTIRENLTEAQTAIATNTQGDAVVAWDAITRDRPRPPNAFSDRLWVAIRRHGRWSAPQPAGGDGASGLVAALGRDGTAIVSYTRPFGAPSRSDHMVAWVADAASTTGRLVAIPRSSDPQSDDCIVAPGDLLVVTWEDASGGTSASTALAGHPFTPGQTISYGGAISGGLTSSTLYLTRTGTVVALTVGQGPTDGQLLENRLQR